MHRIVALSALLALASLASAAPFQNGSFEVGFPITTPAPCFVTLPVGSTNLTGWTVISGNIDWNFTPCGAGSQTDGVTHLDLVGDQGIGGIQQTFDTVPGWVYQVSFDLNGNFGGPPVVKPLRVTVAGNIHDYTFDTTGENAGNSASFWTNKSFSFTATGTSETISFVSNILSSGINAGAAIDNVIVTGAPDPQAPTLTKAFLDPTIPLNGSTLVGFGVRDNQIDSSFLGQISFTDTLPEGLVVSNPNGLIGSCGDGAIVADPGSGTISLTGGTITSPFQPCAFAVSVTGTTAGVKNNVTSNITSSAGTGNAGMATVIVQNPVVPPTLTKSFNAATMAVGESTALSFTVTNPNKTSTLTGVGFSDPLPGGLTVSTPNGLTGSCGGGTIVAGAGSGVITLSGATLPAASTCIFSVNVTATASGTQNNTTGAISSVEGGAGGAASASIRVSAPPPPPRCVAPTITSGSLPTGVVGVAYAASVSASGDSPIVLAVSGLPAGLTFNAATGSIAGVPTAAGTSTLTITASNGCLPNATQTQTLTIGRSASSLSLSATPAVAVFGQVITAVVRASGAPSTPQGVISLCVRETSAFCPAPFDVVPPGTPASTIRAPLTAPLDASGQATFTLTGLLIDNYVLKAAYAGDSAHNGTSAGPIDEFVIKGVLLAPPKVALAAPLRATSGAPLSIGIQVTPIGPGPTPTGTVQLYAGADLVGVAALDAQGSTRLTITAVAAGAFPVRADYSGDTSFPPASSPESMVTVAAFATADIPAIGPAGLALLALAIAGLAMRPLYRRSRRH